MEVLVIILLLATGWYWYDSTVAKEAAVVAARRACERHHQQLLDETVALARIRLRRDGSGRVRLLRLYRFEFSGDGEQRRCGEVTLLGQWVAALNLEMEEFTLYDLDEDREPPTTH